jgi:ABC-type amino acid transport substrate-binding protein
MLKLFTRLTSGLLVLCFVWVTLGTVFAAGGPLRAAVKPLEPFVFAESDTGFSIDLITALAAELGRPLELIRTASVTELLAAVESEQVDLGIAGITINAAREQRVDFSQPMYESGLQILVPAEMPSSFFSLTTLLPLVKPILAFVLVIIAASHLVWWTEHRSNTDFAPTYRQGLWDAIWWSTVTVTTVGYGDKTPKRVPGRLIGMVWMVSGFFIMAFLVGSVTSNLTLQSLRGNIESPADLPGKTVGTVAGTTSESYLQGLGLSPLTYPSITECYAALTAGELQAVVYDAPVLQYYATTTGSGQVRTVGRVFRKEQYGIALPTDSTLRDELNIALLNLQESGKYEELRAKWFGTSN